MAPYKEMIRAGRFRAALASLETEIARRPTERWLRFIRCRLLIDLADMPRADACLAGLRQGGAPTAEEAPVLAQLEQRMVEMRLHQQLQAAPVGTASAPSSQLARSRGPEQQTPRRAARWWLWSSLGAGAAAACVGLILGLTPRAHDRVEWLQ